MNKKRILQVIAMVLVLSMMLSTAAFAMPPGHVKQLMRNQYKFENAFKHMKENGIMYGYGNGDYGLEEYVKRGDITVMIVRAFKLSMMDVDFEEIEDNDFLDLIDKSCYYYSAVKIAKNLKIAKGDGENFYPNNYVSYEEAVLLIDRAVKVANSNVTVLDDDDDEVKLRDWYRDFVEDDADAFKEYLYELLEDVHEDDEGFDFSDPAKREDIALMLYYVLTGDVYDLGENDNKKIEVKDIVINLELNEKRLDFDDLIDEFEEAFDDIEDYEDEDVKYIKFNSVRGGDLYYDYDKIKIRLASDLEYYFDGDTDNDGKNEEREISDLTFIADSKTATINYTAYIEDDIYYSGLIIVKSGERELPKITAEIDENTILNFNTVDFDDIDGFDEIKFELPNREEGKLYVEDDPIYSRDIFYISQLEDITFVPVDDFSGVVEINYVAYYDDDDIPYKGIIEITVEEVLEIDDIEIDEYDIDDEDEFINFVDELEEAADEDIFDEIDYVKFKLPDADEGKLFINYGSRDNYVALVEDEYTLYSIKGLQFEPDEDYNDDEITIFYTAYDKSTNPDKAYDGKIIIELEIEED